MNNFYKKYSGKDDPDLLEEIMENSERYFIPELITLMNNLDSWVAQTYYFMFVP